MINEMKSYVAVLPDGREHFADVRVYDVVDVAREAVRTAKLIAPRTNPQTVAVKVFVLKIKRGTLVRESAGTQTVALPLAPMTEAEFDVEMRTVLDKIPKEFGGLISKEAWDRWHSSGYEDVLAAATSAVEALLPVINTYTQRIQKENQHGR